MRETVREHQTCHGNALGPKVLELSSLLKRLTDNVII